MYAHVYASTLKIDALKITSMLSKITCIILLLYMHYYYLTELHAFIISLLIKQLTTYVSHVKEYFYCNYIFKTESYYAG